MNATYFWARFHIASGLLMATTLLALAPKTAEANPLPDVATVEIFAHYDLNNPPTAQPYSGFVGQFESTSLDFNFGDYTDRTSFVAVVTFSELVTAGSYFDSLVDGGNNNIWYSDWGNGNGPGPYSIGGTESEFALPLGVDVFQVDFIAGEGIPDGTLGLVGGPPYLLHIEPPILDFRNQDPSLPQPVLLPVPDLCGTLELLGMAIMVLGALRHAIRPHCHRFRTL